jgi:drug/metabolite transporter (DMT)-like permease
LLHASWHALVKSGTDQTIVLVGMGLVSAIVAAGALPFLPIPGPAVWLIIACSVLLHVGYKLGLARSYRLADLGQAYPMGRGMVPLFATVIAVFLLGQLPEANQLRGIAVVSCGLLWLGIHSVRWGIDRRLFVAAAVVGITVAGYTSLDAYGVRISGNWASFTAWLVVADSCSFVLLIYLMRQKALWHELWQIRWRMLASGFLGLTSFSIFIWALSRSPVGSVAALREASVLFATIIRMTFYREPRSFHRIGAAATVALGLVIIAALR